MQLHHLIKNKILSYSFLIVRSLLISTVIVATFSKIPIPKAETSEPSTIGWVDSNWLYRKSVTAPNTGSTLVNEDILITIDTSTLVTAGKLQSSCNDLRLVDSDGTTYLSYWIEDGCNTSSTKIWTRIPSLPNGGKAIYMYYGNSSATSNALAWSGNIYMYADTTCPTGWTRASALDNKFLSGSSTFGSTGGTSSHAHNNAVGTSSSIVNTNIGGASSGSTSGPTNTHTHATLTAVINNNASVLPPYEGMILCYSNKFTLSTGLISLFNATVPTGWTRFSSLDNVFPEATATFGATGGSSTHTHTTTTGTVTAAASGTSATAATPLSATGGTITYSGGDTIHTFTSNGTFTANKAGTVTVLIVGGGGGSEQGGGGGGGVYYDTAFSISTDAYSITVGAGGPHLTAGSASSIGTLKSMPGGGGGIKGTSQYGEYKGNSIAGTSGNGYAGGIFHFGEGGGGGATQAGFNGTGTGTEIGGTGGAGYTSSISGTSVCYGGGGGGGAYHVGGTGVCGGGNGGQQTQWATDGTANTGGGAGGVCYSGLGRSGGSGIVIVRYPTPAALTGTIASLSHTHSVSSATPTSGTNTPPYITMIFGKANSPIYANEKNILITSSLPPLGWNRFTAIDNKFTMGSATYGTTGGADTHTHSVTITTGAPSATISSYGTGSNFANSTHTHSVAVTTNAASNLPPYYSVIYTQRKVSLTPTLGTEENENKAPNAPSALLTEGVYNPQRIIDFTPEFSATFTDPNTTDTASYYQIQVNSNSSFTGTTLWDSTKVAFGTPVANTTRSADISYAGATLSQGATYYWRMKMWDNNGYANESSWSTVYQFTTDNTPTALKENISGAANIYAQIGINMTTKYSDLDGASDLDKLYLQIKNPSGTNIEYYATSAGTNQTGQAPTAISGSEYISGITYDLSYGSPTANDITIVWHITTNWGWATSSTLQYGIKAQDKESLSSSYDYVVTTYKYENRLAFTGSLSAENPNHIEISNGGWTKANSNITWSGLKVVYFGTTDIYPNDSFFDVSITNSQSDTWSDLVSSGINISIVTHTPDATSLGSTYTVNISNLPTGAIDASGNPTYVIKVDKTNPTISNFVSSTHLDSDTWYAANSASFSWAISDEESGIKDTWYLFNNIEDATVNDVVLNGTSIAQDNLTISDLENGIWYLHLVTVDNQDNTAIDSYRFKVDASTPDIISITGSYNDTWQNVDSGPTISWTDPHSPSGDTYYITNDGTAPASSNYTYTTVSNTYDLPDQIDGITTIKVIAQNGIGVYSTVKTFIIKYDSTTPSIIAVTGLYNDTWQGVDSGPTISWSDPHSPSGDTYYITNDGSTPTSSNYTYTTTSTSYDLPDQADGEIIINVVAKNGIGVYSTAEPFIVKYDPTTPDIISITGLYNDTWQNVDSGPTISWSDPHSPSGDIYYITNDGTTPTSSNYTYTTTSNTYDLPDQTDGITTIKVIAVNGIGVYSTVKTFVIKYDSTVPNIGTIGGAYNNVWQKVEGGPVISWSNPLSISGDTYYITNDGTTPTSSSYTYTTTSTSYDLPTQKQGETVITVRSLNGAGIYSQAKTFVLRYDTTAPTNVSNLKTSVTQTTVVLLWDNPSSSDFTKVIIIRNTSHAPLSLADGIKVYEGDSNSYTNMDLTANTSYYYTVFAQDALANQSSGTYVQITTSQVPAVPTAPTTPPQPTTPLVPEPTVPKPTVITTVIKIQDLTEQNKVNITTETNPVTITNTGDIHTYTNQSINFIISADTINENSADLQQVVLVIDSHTYIMKFDEERNTYSADISAPEVKGAYDVRIQTISNSNTNDFTVTMSLLVDPYGYVYAKSGNNELRITNANITLYQKISGNKILWASNQNSMNPQYTNTSGEYQFFVEPGEYKLVVEAQGYFPTETEWFTVESNIIKKNIEMKKSPYLLYTLIGIAEIILIPGIFIIAKSIKRSKKRNA